ncbi:PhzF family phenazine biosynthesis protein [Erythrobacter sp. JK5]|uniref:PhzF family phenazine biosynthesis protein n=1 Tax=Erythrobacter sp. JK5 TaxID=2829500 RepID=UPI001BA4ADD6|nr:PhzF family phenazine biosynthesis protein [Erythrobacter sp. JK5]QUL37359.1 PhzF family phenazine biosynthesis protein [Erythrobacter sp. JK5]
MPAIPYWHVDAFAAQPFGGNQAAVMVLDAWLPDDVLVKIGAENNFAETAFLVRDETGQADWELRWFTPTNEIRLCGHATLASGHTLLTHFAEYADSPNVTFLTRKSGLLEVRSEGDAYEVGLPAIPTEREDWADAADVLGGNPDEAWRNPLGYNLFLYEDEAAIRALAPDFRKLAALGDHLFVCTAPGTASDIVSRVFVPAHGIDEDPVTGGAHAVLTPFWCARLGRGTFTAHQASARGGDLTCRLDGDRVWLGGPCVTVVEGVFHL